MHLQGQYSPSLGNFEYIVQPNLDEDFTWSDCPFKCPAPFHGSQSGDVTNSVPCLPEELQEPEDFGCCTQDNNKIYPGCKSSPGPGEGRRRPKYSLAGAEQLDSTCSGPCPKVRCRSKLVAPCGTSCIWLQCRAISAPNQEPWTLTHARGVTTAPRSPCSQWHAKLGPLETT